MNTMEGFISPDDVPDAFLCPITKDLMTDPVSTCDGQTYERTAISTWLQLKKVSPVTGLGLASLDVTPNIALRKAIDHWIINQCKLITPSRLTIGQSLTSSVYLASLKPNDGHHDHHDFPVLVYRHKGNMNDNVTQNHWALANLGKHPRILSFIGICSVPVQEKLDSNSLAGVFFVFEHAPLGPLAQSPYLHDMCLAHHILVLQQTCSALETLYSQGVAHNSVSLEDVFLVDFDQNNTTRLSIKIGGASHSSHPLKSDELDQCEKNDVGAFGLFGCSLLHRIQSPASQADASANAQVANSDIRQRPARCAAAEYDELWKLLSLCLVDTIPNRPTFAMLSTLLGSLGTVRSTSHPVVLPHMVSVADVAPEDLYVLRSTGALVNMAWLFEHGYSKNDCDLVRAVAPAARQYIKSSGESLAAEVQTLKHALTSVSETQVALDRDATNCIQKIESSIRSAISDVTEALSERGKTLQNTLTDTVKRRRHALEAQRSALTQMIDVKESLLDVARSAEADSDSAVIEAKYQIETELSNLNLKVKCEPVVGTSIPCHFDSERVAQQNLSWMSFGSVGIEPPNLTGYRCMSPTFVVSQQVDPNYPIFESHDVNLDLLSMPPAMTFSVEPPLPDGLQLDQSTGVISGTPLVQWSESHTVSARNKGGTSSVQLKISVSPPHPNCAIIVSDCGMSEFNGRYVLDTSKTGGPGYRKVRGNATIERFGANKWLMCKDYGDQTYYKQVTAQSESVPLRDWVAVTGTGAPPSLLLVEDSGDVASGSSQEYPIVVVSDAGIESFNGRYVFDYEKQGEPGYRKIGGVETIELYGEERKWLMCVNYGDATYYRQLGRSETIPTEGWEISTSGISPSPTVSLELQSTIATQRSVRPRVVVSGAGLSRFNGEYIYDTNRAWGLVGYRKQGGPETIEQHGSQRSWYMCINYGRTYYKFIHSQSETEVPCGRWTEGNLGEAPPPVVMHSSPP